MNSSPAERLSAIALAAHDNALPFQEAAENEKAQRNGWASGFK